jgi:hypothetical protein
MTKTDRIGVGTSTVRMLVTLLSLAACRQDEPPTEPKPPQPSCDLRMLFASDGLAGVGCSGAICHGAGGPSIDLESAGLEDRLRDQPANPAGPCAGEVLIDSTDPANSLLLKKVNGTSDCGSPMPLTNLSAFTQDQVRCVTEYVELTAAQAHTN